MHVAFGRVRRRIAPLRTSFSLMRSGYSEMVSVVGKEKCRYKCRTYRTEDRQSKKAFLFAPNTHLRKSEI